MQGNKQVDDTAFHLFRLPKERAVLDFVLQKLGEGASPERFELLEALLNMYRTSTGFNPMAMSKVRFKRLKAAAFRQTLTAIDQEIGQLLQSPDFQLVISKKSDLTPLFHFFSDLSTAVQLHPALSLTDELEAFENNCEQNEAEELLLGFYRRNAPFIEEINRKEGPEIFLKKYDRILERQQQLQRQFRIGFELILLEQAAEKGMRHDENAKAVLEELGVLLTREPHTRNQYALLLKIIRATALTSSPARNISPWVEFLRESGRELLTYHPEAVILILTAMARYSLTSGREQRIQWLEEAEKEARLRELTDERPGLRIVRAMIEADYGHPESAMIHLNEVEHLIFRATTRSLASRNNWIQLAELKTLLFVLKTMQGEVISQEQFRQMQQLAEDMGKHRHEIAILLLEWRGLGQFIQESYEEAFHSFEKARSYRKNQSDHPWHLLDRFFCALLSKAKKKTDTASLITSMKNLNEPFYTEVCCSIMELAKQRVEHNKTLRPPSGHFISD